VFIKCYIFYCNQVYLYWDNNNWLSERTSSPPKICCLFSRTCSTDLGWWNLSALLPGLGLELELWLPLP